MLDVDHKYLCDKSTLTVKLFLHRQV